MWPVQTPSERRQLHNNNVMPVKQHPIQSLHDRQRNLGTHVPYAHARKLQVMARAYVHRCGRQQPGHLHCQPFTPENTVARMPIAMEPRTRPSDAYSLTFGPDGKLYGTAHSGWEAERLGIEWSNSKDPYNGDCSHQNRKFRHNRTE